ncbi:MAG: ArsA-related P-loop ATPase [Myxococcota bacterium]|nr:ArsA-related P-loop ATPase [Myxococcota bacterium]
MNPIQDLILTRKVIVCCGAGGVGKTTTSAALGLAAARQVKNVLVVTIDPSKRLAEALGVDRNPERPIPVDTTGLIDQSSTGSLAAWMLDPQLIADRVVERFSGSNRDASTLMNNPIYQNVTAMVAGMQEYTAVQALYEFIHDERYDLIILDTPPSRDALRFLDAPERASAFLDRRIFNLFVPGEGSAIRRMTTKLLEKVMDVSFGPETRRELQQFFQLFGGLLSQLNHNQSEMRRFFGGQDVSFLLVTAPTSAALEETQFFSRRATEELQLHVAGVILNRSLTHCRNWKMPDTDRIERPDPVLSVAISKLRQFSLRERHLMEGHVKLKADLAALSGHGWVYTLPHLGPDASTLDGLSAIADFMTDGEDDKNTK